MASGELAGAGAAAADGADRSIGGRPGRLALRSSISICRGDSFMAERSGSLSGLE
jgi:hypothetical protein